MTYVCRPHAESSYFAKHHLSCILPGLIRDIEIASMPPETRLLARVNEMMRQGSCEIRVGSRVFEGVQGDLLADPNLLNDPTLTVACEELEPIRFPGVEASSAVLVRGGFVLAGLEIGSWIWNHKSLIKIGIELLRQSYRATRTDETQGVTEESLAENNHEPAEDPSWVRLGKKLVHAAREVDMFFPRTDEDKEFTFFFVALIDMGVFDEKSPNFLKNHSCGKEVLALQEKLEGIQDRMRGASDRERRRLREEANVLLTKIKDLLETCIPAMAKRKKAAKEEKKP